MASMTRHALLPLFLFSCLILVASLYTRPADAFVMMTEEQEIKIGEQVARGRQVARVNRLRHGESFGGFFRRPRA